MEVRIEAQTPQAPLNFSTGLKTGLPIAIGYIPIAIAFGLLAKSTGIPDYISVCMSLLIFAGASQFVGVNLLALGAASWEVILTTFILNLRHFLMSASLAQRLQAGTTKRMLSLVAFGITDETFTVASLHPQAKLPPLFILGINSISFAAWNVGTWMGVFLAAGLPAVLKASMGIALYAMFIGLLVPSARKSWPVVTVALTAIAVNTALPKLVAGISPGWSIIIATITGALAGAVVFPQGVNAHE